MKIEWTPTRLESILQREFEIGTRRILLHGSATPLSLGFFLSQSHSKEINNLPHLVVVPSLADANRLEQVFASFDPSRRCLTFAGFDVSPYSGLYPSPQISGDRLHFLSWARQARAQTSDIFIVTADALLQNVLPAKVFDQHSRFFSVGEEIPEDWSSALDLLGYQAAPVVEDRGQYSVRGGIIDIWSPAESHPIRIELFGDQIESLRSFNSSDQRSIEEKKRFLFAPAREVFYQEENYEETVQRVRSNLQKRSVPANDSEDILRSLVLKQFFSGIEFLSPFFFKELDHPFSYFQTSLNVWILDSESIARAADESLNEIKQDEKASVTAVIHPPLRDFFTEMDSWTYPQESRVVTWSLLDTLTDDHSEIRKVDYRSHGVQDLTNLGQSLAFGTDSWISAFKTKLSNWRNDGYRIFIAARVGPGLERLKFALEKMDFRTEVAAPEEFLWDHWVSKMDSQENLLQLIPHTFPESLRLDEERIVFLRDEDFFGKKERRRASTGAEDFQSQARRLAFGDLKPGDLVVHVKHGIGQYEGLKLMSINGVDSEFIQVSYKDKDKLYLPVYRVGQLQKYASAATTTILDKLGGTGWEKTKSKVKSHLRDIASELLALYAKRAEAHRQPFEILENDVVQFEKGFPYDETDDQLRAINDIKRDFLSTRPADRLICGDVGFGKTEVAMRAAFFAVQSGKQVAVLAPTTVLTFQHFETFKKRFHGWPIEIRVLNRFVENSEAKKTVKELKEGKVHILIGTHRLLSKDIAFQDLGLLVIDEEQKFGVAHKEKIRKMKFNVDTISLSATPIPRTLNMSFAGVRDLSLINSAPVDRLPIRTFISKWEEETIRKAITSEIARGGQIYFIHNRIQSIYGIADEVRQIVPDARIKIAHGQMDEEQLEQAMLSFFNHEIDILICTAIVESGMDVPRANTMFIDRADMFGLSQLYQLRGRVGRSKLRGYCYLLLPKNKKLDKDAQERLKVIQENTALGSGLRIAQYDLELRGSGTIIGEEQSGHIDSVGYELYMDLLKEAVAEAKGEPGELSEIDPEINLRIPAMIPDSYIQDVRIRLSYYKALAEITTEEDINRIGDELKDQYGSLPDPVLNLMGLMLIRRQCKDLGVRDVSAGVKTISLIFTERTKLKPETVIKLAMRENKKYAITPDNRLNIRMNSITWTGVYEELNQLLRLIDSF